MFGTNLKKITEKDANTIIKMVDDIAEIDDEVFQNLLKQLKDYHFALKLDNEDED